VTRPSVLLLDEPFSALDAFTRAELQDHLLDLWEEGRPILVHVTHDIEEALVLASRVVVMRAQPGRIAGILDVPLPRPRDRPAPRRPPLARLRRPETAPAAAVRFHAARPPCPEAAAARFPDLIRNHPGSLCRQQNSERMR